MTGARAASRTGAGRHERIGSASGVVAMNGVAVLLRLALRRDRVWLTCWLAAIAFQVAGTASAYAALYPDAASRRALQGSIGDNPAFLALYGPAFDLSSIGGLTAWRVAGSAAALGGLMGLLTVIRHSRADEESGRLELVRSGVVDRQAPLAAAMAEACLAGVFLGALVTALLAAQHLPVAGALALGSGIAGCTLVFAAVGAVVAQVAQASRSARALGVLLLVAAFAVRAVGDLDVAGGGGTSHGGTSHGGTSHGVGWVRWLSPVGWSQEVRPFAGERWWVLLLPLTCVVVLGTCGVVVQGRRDLDAALIAPRLGAAHGTMGSAYALAWRLQRGSLIVWCLTMGAVGVLCGALAGTLSSFTTDSPALAEALRRIGGDSGLVDSFLAAIFAVMALVGSVQGVQSVLRLRSEESSGHLEALQAAGASRAALLLSHAAYAVLGPVLIMAVAGAGAGISRASATGHGSDVTGLLGAALAQVPAMELVVGLTVALAGLAPRLLAAAWLALAAFGLLGEVGPLLRLPEDVLRMSPFASDPQLPGGRVELLPVVLILAAAAALAAAGYRGFQRRDLCA